MKKKLIVKSIGALLIIFALSLSIGEDLIEGKKTTLDSFILIHTAGYLFFLLMPVELLFFYYLSEGHNALLLIILAVGTALIAQMIDYLIGILASKKIIEDYIGIKTYKKFKKKMLGKYRNLIIIFFNITFLSSPIIALIAGIMKIKLKNLLIYSAIGLLLKYTILTLAYYQLY